jgi:hypothetical protein
MLEAHEVRLKQRVGAAASRAEVLSIPKLHAVGETPPDERTALNQGKSRMLVATVLRRLWPSPALSPFAFLRTRPV